MPVVELTRFVVISWPPPRGNEGEAELDVTYTFDGETVSNVRFEAYDHYGIDDWDFETLVTEQIEDNAHEDYAEHLADLGDYLSGMAEDRELTRHELECE